MIIALVDLVPNAAEEQKAGEGLHSLALDAQYRSGIRASFQQERIHHICWALSLSHSSSYSECRHSSDQKVRVEEPQCLTNK